MHWAQKVYPWIWGSSHPHPLQGLRPFPSGWVLRRPGRVLGARTLEPGPYGHGHRDVLLYTLWGPFPFESGRREVELPLLRQHSAQAAALQAGSNATPPA